MSDRLLGRWMTEAIPIEADWKAVQDARVALSGWSDAKVLRMERHMRRMAAIARSPYGALVVERKLSCIPLGEITRPQLLAIHVLRCTAHADTAQAVDFHRQILDAQQSLTVQDNYQLVEELKRLEVHTTLQRELIEREREDKNQLTQEMTRLEPDARLGKKVRRQRSAFGAEGGKARRKFGPKNHELWERLATDIWRKNPKVSRLKISMQIAKLDSDRPSPETVRKYLSKKSGS